MKGFLRAPGVVAAWLARDRDPASWDEELDGTLEHPWAFHQIQALGQELTIVEVGGGGDDAGLRATLARAGHRVIAVGAAAVPSGAVIAMRADVMRQADIPDASVDVLVSINGLEHLPDAEARDVVQKSRRMLRPGGHLVLTTTAADVHPLLAAVDAELIAGDLVRRHGFVDLTTGARAETAEASARCFVARKR